MLCCAWLDIHCLLIWRIQPPGALPSLNVGYIFCICHRLSMLSFLSMIYSPPSAPTLSWLLLFFQGSDNIPAPVLHTIYFVALFFRTDLSLASSFPFLAPPSVSSMLVSILPQSALHLSGCCILQIKSLLPHPPLSSLLPLPWNSLPWCSLFSVQLWSTCFMSRPYSKQLSVLFLCKCPPAILFLFHHLLLSGKIFQSQLMFYYLV